MTINEFFDKYFGHLYGYFSINDKMDGDIQDTTDSCQFRIINDLPESSYDAFNTILPLFTKLSSGCSLFINEVNSDIRGYFHDLFNNIKEDLSPITGATIVHIIGVGYIITALHQSKQFLYMEYSLDDYDSLSNQYIVAGMAKQEMHYIRDWVEYHLHIGFDRIILFDNNDLDGEQYNDVLSDFIESGKLHIINARGQKSVQCDLYNSFLYGVPFKWCAFIDIDEFIWFNEKGPYNNIKQFLDTVDSPDYFGAMLQWHCYKATGDDKPSDLPIWEVCNELVDFNARKDSRCEYINDWCKSIYKRGYPIECNEHFGWFTKGSFPAKKLTQVSSNRHELKKSDLSQISKEDFDNQFVYVKHFLLRNINEFYYNKYMRGHAGLPGIEGLDGWAYYQWRQNMNYFTDITPVLTDKEQLFMAKLGMKVNYTFHPDVFINLQVIPGNDHIHNRIMNLLTANIFPNTNVYFAESIIRTNGTPTAAQLIPDNPAKLITGVDFLTEYINIHYDFGSMYSSYYQVRKFIQSPVIINIGFPYHWIYTQVSLEEQEEYLHHLECMLLWENIKPLIRSALLQDTTTLLKIGTKNEPDCFGWRDTLQEFMNEQGLSIPKSTITNNTFIMSYETYQKYRKFQNEFTNKFGFVVNDDIINGIKYNKTTSYHAFISSIAAVFDNPYYIWPS